MNFRKKIQKSQQKPQPLRRVDGIVTYASVRKSLPDQKRNAGSLHTLVLRRRNVSGTPARRWPAALLISSLFAGRPAKRIHRTRGHLFDGKGIAAPCFFAKKKSSHRASTFFKHFFHELKRMFYSHPVFAKRVFASIVILAIVSTALFQNTQQAFGATYYWNQLGWSGGANPSSYAVHPGNQNGWNQFSSKDSFVEAKNNSGDDVVELNSISESSVQTSDNGLEDTHNA